MADDDSLGAKLDILIKLQATHMASSLSTKKEKIQFLDAAGLSPKFIAEIVKTTPASVSQTLYSERKKTAHGEG